MRFVRFALFLTALATMSGCASLLPRGDSVNERPWDSFEQAHAMYQRIRPHQTTLAELRAMGIDPTATPNVVTLSYTDMLHRLVPPSEHIELDPAIAACLQRQEHCRGYLIEQRHVETRRVGNFWLDFLNFRRDTATHGWRFSMLLLVVDDRVVYKIWGGEPSMVDRQLEVNPLGPLQGMSISALRGL